jgi:hypothetical protein
MRHGRNKCEPLGMLDMKALGIAGVLDCGLWGRLSSFIVFLTFIASCKEQNTHDQHRGRADDALIHAKTPRFLKLYASEDTPQGLPIFRLVSTLSFDSCSAFSRPSALF